MSENNFFVDINLNQNELKQAVLDKVTSATRPANPVDGQLIYETDTKNIMKYNSTKAKWEPVGIQGARVIKGVVGGSSQGALQNLPTTNVNVGDEYIVGVDGNYGPQDAEQYATKGDSFIALTESGANPVDWLLIDNNNRVSGSFTVASGTTSYTITNTSGSTDLIVQVRDSNGEIIPGFNVVVSQANITISMSSVSAIAQNGNTFYVMASNG